MLLIFMLILSGLALTISGAVLLIRIFPDNYYGPPKNWRGIISLTIVLLLTFGTFLELYRRHEHHLTQNHKQACVSAGGHVVSLPHSYAGCITGQLLDTWERN